MFCAHIGAKHNSSTSNWPTCLTSPSLRDPSAMAEVLVWFTCKVDGYNKILAMFQQLSSRHVWYFAGQNVDFTLVEEQQWHGNAILICTTARKNVEKSCLQKATTAMMSFAYSIVACVWNRSRPSNAQVLTTITNLPTVSHLHSDPNLVSCTFYTIPILPVFNSENFCSIVIHQAVVTTDIHVYDVINT